MASIIKATDRNAAIQPVAFNFDDMASQAGKYLDKVRAEAAKIVADAKSEAAAIQQRAEAEGRKAGREAAEQVARKQLASVLPSLKKVVQDIAHAKQGWLAQWEKASVHLAAAIAQRIIRHELPNLPEVTPTLVREALELAAGSNRLRIALSPDDHTALSNQIETMVKELSGLAEAEIVADATISPGGCKVETRYGVIDQQFEAQLARIEDELTRT